MCQAVKVFQSTVFSVAMSLWDQLHIVCRKRVMPLPWGTGLAALLSYTLSRKDPSLPGDPTTLSAAAGDRIAVVFSKHCL